MIRFKQLTCRTEKGRASNLTVFIKLIPDHLKIVLCGWIKRFADIAYILFEHMLGRLQYFIYYAL